MRNLILLLILFSAQTFAASRMQFEFPASELHQGSIIKARLFVPPDSLNLPLQKLKGETIADTLYFQQLSPLLKRESSTQYVSEVHVVFIKVPESNSLTVRINEETIELGWNNVHIIPVDAPEKLIWANFTAPDFFEGNLLWAWIVLSILIIASLGFYGWKKISVRKAAAARKRQLIDEFKACQSYDDVVSMWKRKRTYLKEFPHLESYFQPFEEVLFRYQFKPSQTEQEKAEVLNAYRRLLDQCEGGFYGV